LLLVALGLVVPAAMSAAAPEPAPERIPAESFGTLPFFSDPEVSPDGKRLVARSVVGGKTSVILADLTRNDYGLAKIALPKDMHMLWARWAGNGKVVMSLAIPTSLYGQEFHGSRLFAYDLASVKMQPLATKVATYDGDNVIHIDPAGRYLLLAAQQLYQSFPSVWRIDLTTLQRKEVVRAHMGVWEWFADPNGVVRAGLGFGTDQWWLMYRASPDDRFKRILTKRIQPKHGRDKIEKVIPVAGRDTGYAVADKGTGRFAVYHYDFRNDVIGDAVFEHPEVDVDDVDYSSRTGELATISYVDDRDRIVWLEPDMKKVQARIDRAFPGSVNRVVSRDADGRTMIVWVGGASDPGTYYVFDRGKGEMRLLAKPYTALEGKRLSTVEPVRYAARDGLTIPAYLTLPAGRAAKGLPLIVMPHGGPFVRDKWTYDSWVQLLANRGYAVLQPNFRGSTGYGQAFAEAGAGQFGRKMQDDLDDGVAWLAKRGLVDPKRVCIMGASYGGYAAMWAAVRNPEIYRCAVSFAGISHVPPMIRYSSQRWIAKRYYQDWRDRIRGAEKFDLDKVSPLTLASRVRIPIMIAHGREDQVVPVAQSTMMHQALERKKIPHEYIIYDGEGHGFEKEANSIDFLKRVDAFLARHNPAG
jgi:dipeptidyl aminopeptidase/acylaminoacyl peptidase